MTVYFSKYKHPRVIWYMLILQNVTSLSRSFKIRTEVKRQTWQLVTRVPDFTGKLAFKLTVFLLNFVVLYLSIKIYFYLKTFLIYTDEINQHIFSRRNALIQQQTNGFYSWNFKKYCLKTIANGQLDLVKRNLNWMFYLDLNCNWVII